MVCPKAAYQGRQANAYKHGNDKNTLFHPYSPYSGYHFTGKTGVVLIVMGVAFQSLSHTLGGSDVKDFFSGLLLGLSVAEMLAGIAVICKGAKRK